MSAAFFLLGGNVKDAVKIALDKINDAVLALLIARLGEKESFGTDGQPEKTEDSWQQKVLLEHYIQRGERLGDPYLQNIGHWLRKDYVKAVNVFHVDPSRFNNLPSMF